MKSNMDKYDDIFKKSFDENQLDKEDWLTPDGDVFTNINAVISKKKKKRKFGLLWLLFPIILVGSFWYFYSNFNSSEIKKEATTEVSNNHSANNKLNNSSKKKDNQNEINNLNERKINDPSSRQQTDSKEINFLTESKASQPNVITTTSKTNNSGINNKLVSPASHNSISNIDYNNRNNLNNTIPTKPSISSPTPISASNVNNDSPTPLKKDNINNVTLENNFKEDLSVDPENNSIIIQDGANDISLNIINDGLSNGLSNGLNDELLDEVKYSDFEENINQTNPPSATSSFLTVDKKTSIDQLNLLPLKKYKIPIIRSNVIQDFKTSFIKTNIPNASLQLYLSGGVVLWSDRLNQNYISALAPADFSNNTGYGYTLNVGIEKAFHETFSLGLQFGYQSIKTQSGHNAEIEYRTDTETGLKNEYNDVTLATPYGFVSSDFIISRRNSSTDEATLLASIHSKHQFSFLSVEPKLNIVLVQSKLFTFNANLGIGYNHLLELENELDHINTNHSEYSYSAGDILSDQQYLKNGYWNISVGASLSYQISNNHVFRFGTQMKEGISPLFEGNEFSSIPRSYHINLSFTQKL